jgi:hypothetical protein
MSETAIIAAAVQQQTAAVQRVCNIVPQQRVREDLKYSTAGSYCWAALCSAASILVARWLWSQRCLHLSVSVLRITSS